MPLKFLGQTGDTDAADYVRELVKYADIRDYDASEKSRLRQQIEALTQLNGALLGALARAGVVTAADLNDIYVPGIDVEDV